jgi:hypothetical protein
MSVETDRDSLRYPQDRCGRCGRRGFCPGSGQLAIRDRGWLECPVCGKRMSAMNWQKVIGTHICACEPLLPPKRQGG